ncbi:MAG: CDP-2,3-bis-(O-geranylgeranyl)-sn-glycerol synthase [Thermoplasmata archaeon]
MWKSVLLGILAFVPALVANSLAVVFGGRGSSMDFGVKLQGKRLLGDGKTWSGFFGGAISAGLLGLVLNVTPLDLYPNLLLPFMLSFGSMLGDLMGSLIKRRAGWKRGENVPILDQYDFVFGSFLICMLSYPGWTIDTYFKGYGLSTFIIILIAVPALHRGVNIIGYKLGLKNEPW